MSQLPSDLDTEIYLELNADALGWPRSCRGTDVYSRWIYRDRLLKLLRQLSFRQVEIAFDDEEHPSGPSFCFVKNEAS